MFRVLRNDAHAAGLRTFFSFNNIELYLRSFLKVGATCVVSMNEHVFASVVGSNEAKTIVCIEELHGTFLHIASRLI